MSSLTSLGLQTRHQLKRSNKQQVVTPDAANPRFIESSTENNMIQPKSQQQLEIEFLRKQVVELQATITDLQARKQKREGLEWEQKAKKGKSLDTSMNRTINQLATVQQLNEHNAKLQSQVTKHLRQLKLLEQMARLRYLSTPVPEPLQHTTEACYCPMSYHCMHSTI
ncbi:uncharacterized protein PHALS_11512 [Plasmopara halstedii]|uniref:Uncharacterized protein n=1 Tax=Plasmopara halstedii TaxID=4781 RepID=A0A0P1A6H2_PLAHL|nr:uncharacterized protein PHALS_11512 [Plasmopara halstedii]CEG35641.1 hypothetical protein PHALS_11512 [Plasmopara halstedii]|eukprot:XP_024572010.1 hypothetical protein PHALS_11512 [Plasmopara halstedii]